MVCNPSIDIVINPRDTEKSLKNSRAGGRGKISNKMRGKNTKVTSKTNHKRA